MPSSPFPNEWMRGTLALAVLGVIAEGVTYGYAIIERLEAAGLGSIKGGTLYPLLARLESAGLVSPVWHVGQGGPDRKYLTLTKAGRDELMENRKQWRQFNSIIDSLAYLTNEGE
jgi:PadR family transcriptional regulator PadR